MSLVGRGRRRRVGGVAGGVWRRRDRWAGGGVAHPVSRFVGFRVADAADVDVLFDDAPQVVDAGADFTTYEGLIYLYIGSSGAV